MKSFLDKIRQMLEIAKKQQIRIDRRANDKRYRGTKYHQEADMDFWKPMMDDPEKYNVVAAAKYSTCRDKQGPKQCADKLIRTMNLPKVRDVQLDPTSYTDHTNAYVREYARKLVSGEN